jgi:excinuclease ABC subunit A
LLYQIPVTASRQSAANPNIQSAALYRDAATINIADFYQFSIHGALAFIEEIYSRRKNLKANDPLTLALNEVRSRLSFLDEVGLGYLTLDRATRTLSGGETERVNLTTCLGSGLVNTLFVLDEPSVGLHPRDTDRLIKILQRLRDSGNTVVVVEHEASVMRAADQIVDLGPGHGESGGDLVFQGTFGEILKSKNSLTGQYLSGKKRVEIPERRAVDSQNPFLKIANANVHNLKNLSVEIPLGRFVCITGVSGSGKTTLVRDVLLPALQKKLSAQDSEIPAEESEDRDEDDSTPNAPRSETEISGWENLSRVLLVDQSPLGKTPRSNPAVYIGAFDEIRELFAQTELAKQRGLNASAFSFNSAQGQCERCRGAGFEKIEMQFLSDVFIRCPDCDGRRYRPHILEVKISSSESGVSSSPQRGANKNPELETRNPKLMKWSIADMLEATVDEAIEFLSGFSDSRPARRAMESLKLLQEVGLGYLKLGQPINTLSGGESQRLKLVKHLAEATCFRHLAENPERDCRQDPGSTLFLFDEPTTGLHFDDVCVLLKVFQRIVDAGHSVLVIEHNLDVIKSADWIIDLGPDAGDEGGKIVAEGTPEEIAECAGSHTGRALKTVLNQNPTQPDHEKNSRNRLARGRSRFAC